MAAWIAACNSFRRIRRAKGSRSASASFDSASIATSMSALRSGPGGSARAIQSIPNYPPFALNPQGIFAMVEPLWYRTAQQQIGVAEVAGPKSSPKILQWAGQVGKWLGVDYSDDRTPWCGLFVAMCLQSANYQPPKIAIRAKSWALWGEELDHGILGSILVFERPGGGHVGFYAGETSTAYKVLGGNQGDKVSYCWIAKPRCVAIRWPHGHPKTAPVHLASAGQTSTNEA